MTRLFYTAAALLALAHAAPPSAHAQEAAQAGPRRVVAPWAPAPALARDPAPVAQRRAAPRGVIGGVAGGVLGAAVGGALGYALDNIEVSKRRAGELTVRGAVLGAAAGAALGVGVEWLLRL
jgi:hypothetical protein